MSVFKQKRSDFIRQALYQIQPGEERHIANCTNLGSDRVSLNRIKKELGINLITTVADGELWVKRTS